MRATAPLIHLERPSSRRERNYLDACHRSRALHRGFVTSAINSGEYREYLRRARRPTQESFFVIAAASDDLAGVVDINDIAWERESSGRLGYYAFVPHAATGLMREGLIRVIDLAFRELGLLRIEARIQPANLRSLRLAQSLGFGRDEGGRGYLKIGARWIDHELWMLRAHGGHARADRLYARA
jgi:[ribosomal protein S5]-alanine N-acetyltransferase